MTHLFDSLGEAINQFNHRWAMEQNQRVAAQERQLGANGSWRTPLVLAGGAGLGLAGWRMARAWGAFGVALQPVVPGVWTCTGLGVGRVYVIDDADGLTIIDTSIASAAPKIIAQLYASSYGPNDVRRIVITHAHPDHIGGLPDLHAWCQADVIAPASEAAAVAGEAPVPMTKTVTRLMDRFGEPHVLPGAPVRRAVQAGDVLEDVLGGLQVIAAPGHTAGQLAFWQPERRILFCGDAMVRKPQLGLPFSIVTADMAEARRTIIKLAELRPDVLCCGHGQPLTNNTADTLAAFARKLAEDGSREMGERS